ncbi:MAG TPA: hypothetical protein VH083_20515 [Myxococcales bacterium]|nr:hypothetical protein [Myxococcales bacterium]
MARKQRRGPGQGPREPQQPQQQQPSQGGGGGGGWGPLRDSIRRDVEQAVSALAFAERLHARLDTQRRAFLDFPRVLEQLRSGALERLTASLSRLYEGGQGFDVQRFLRDLPLALAQLAAAEKSKSQPPAASQPPPASQPPAAAEAPAASETPAASEPTAAAEPPAAEAAAPAETPAAPVETAPVAPEEAAKVSPRLELRSKLLAAAPNLAKAAQGYRRNVATVRRAATPRRSPGPWRADREVLEEAARAVDFVQKLYDTYAEAWADQPLPANLHEEASAETDRFLAWTQLDRYVELAVAAKSTAPKPGKPGQQVISAPNETPQPVTEASPGATVAQSEEPTPEAAATATADAVPEPEKV